MKTVMDPKSSQGSFRAKIVDAERSSHCANSLCRTSNVHSPGSTTASPTVSVAVAGSSTENSSHSNLLWNFGESFNANQAEEDCQLQLSLALRYAVASAAMDNTDFSWFGTTNLLAWGGRAETMEYHYWVTNCLSYEDQIDDGFYEILGMSPYVWSMCTDSNNLAPMPSLDELRCVPPSSDLSVEVVLIDRKTDPDLRELEDEVLRTAYSSSEVLDLARKLGKLVARVMGGSHLKEEDLLEMWLTDRKRLMQLSGSIVLPIGAVRHGTYRHRALLFKVLADSVGLPCRLVRDNSYCWKVDGAIVVVKDSDEREFLVDLCSEPGLLTPPNAKINVLPAMITPLLQFEPSEQFAAWNLKVVNQSGHNLASTLSSVSPIDDPLAYLQTLPNQSRDHSPCKRNSDESTKVFAAAQDIQGTLKEKACQRCMKSGGKEKDDAKDQQVVIKCFEAVHISEAEDFIVASPKLCDPESIAVDIAQLHDHSHPAENVIAKVDEDTIPNSNLAFLVSSKPFVAGSELTCEAANKDKHAPISNLEWISGEANDHLTNKDVRSIKTNNVLECMSNDFEIQWEDIVLGDSIGQGSYGKVYRADWQGSDVAVKIFLDQEFKEETLDEFRKEVSIMRRLRHPNIVLFMGAVTKPPNLCILTEFCPRGSLFRLLHRTDRELDERRRVRMALDIAKGMNYLHKCSPPVVHRDLKSPNLLVDKNWTVKVCDFGLSQMKHNTFLTSKSGAGTPEWMAPEVLRNEPSDEKSDVYSFGVILWELATLQQPWAGLSPIQVVGAVGFQHRRLPIHDNFDPEITNIIHTCWFSDPRSRPTFFDIMQKLKICRRLTTSQTSH